MLGKKKMLFKRSVEGSNSSSKGSIDCNENMLKPPAFSMNAGREANHNTNHNEKHKYYRKLSSEKDAKDKGDSKSKSGFKADKNKGKAVSPTTKKRSFDMLDLSEQKTLRSHGRKLTSNSEWDEVVKYPAEYVLPVGIDISNRRSSAQRVSYRKAIQKAGYNMTELGSPTSGGALPPTLKKLPPALTEIDWNESATADHHIWNTTNASGDLCYIGEKDCQKSGPRKKCSACHIVVHEQCLPFLALIGFQCKLTFREVPSRIMREALVVHHHWVHRRKQDGKCKQCGKSFEKRFGFREPTKILAISCSWCKEAYHNKVSCFEMHKIHEPCTMGFLSKSIVPPTWIIKSSLSKKSVRNRSKRKKGQSGTWRKRSSRDNKPKTFIIRPLSQQAAFVSPTLIFINPKSGGKQGAKLHQVFQWLVNPRQIFDLSKGGPQEALELYRKVPNLRVLACGGDGTVGWVLSVLDKLNMSKPPPVAILPLGTGNDLSRTLNFGPGYTDEPIHKIIQGVEDARMVKLDRWKLVVEKNEDARMEEEDGNALSLSSSEPASDGVDKPPLDIVNNYFSIGSDAQVSLNFHESRESHPTKFTSRFGNKIFYARAGVNEYLTRQSKDLSKHIKVECDGVDITQKIRDLKPVCVLFLNIPKFSSGTTPWGNPGSDYQAQRHDDKLIEVLALSLNQLGMLFVGGHGDRLCQCKSAVITTTKTLPVQIDGEPCRLNPSIVKLEFFNQANMLYRSKRPSVNLEPQQPQEQIKIRVNVIQIQNFEAFNGVKEKLCSSATPLLVTVVMNQSTLDTVRSCLLLTMGESERPTDLVSEKWVFVDATSNSDKFYKVDRRQENLIAVSEIITADREVYILDMIDPTSSESGVRNVLPRSHLIDTHSDALRNRVLSEPAVSNSPSRSYTGTSKSEHWKDTEWDELVGSTANEADAASTLLDFVFEQPDDVVKDEASADIGVTQQRTNGDVMQRLDTSTESLPTIKSAASSLRESEGRYESDCSSYSTSSNEYFVSDDASLYSASPTVSCKAALRSTNSNPPLNSLPMTFSTQMNLDDQRKIFKTHKRSYTDADAKKIAGLSFLKGYTNKNDSNNNGRKKVLRNLVIPSKLHNKTMSDYHAKKTASENAFASPKTGKDENSNVNWNKIFLDASKRGDLEKMAVSLREGADLRSRDEEGCTALHLAVRFSYDKIVDYLLEQGDMKIVDLICRDRKQTALHKAAWYGRVDICKKLVNAGASLQLRDYKGMAAIDKARQADSADLVHFLASVQQTNTIQNTKGFYETDF